MQNFRHIIPLILAGLSTAAFGEVELRWTPIAEMGTPRAGFAAVVHQGRIFVFGGMGDQQMELLAGAEVYEPREDHWSDIADLPRPLANPSAIVVGDNIFIIGGRMQRNEISDIIFHYDIANDRYRQIARLPQGVFAQAGVAYDDKVLLQGGSPAFQRYLRSGLWLTLPDGGHTEAPEMNFARSYFGLVQYGPMLWAIGGVSFGGPVAVVEALVDGRWQSRIRMPMPRGQLGVAVLGDTILVVGGMTIQEQVSDVVHGYLPRSNRWTDALPRMNSPRADFALVALGRQIYAIGGRSGGWHGMGRVMASGEVLEYEVVSVPDRLATPVSINLSPVHPNPANGYAMFNFPPRGGVLTVWSPSGRLLLNRKVNEPVYRLPVSGLPAGAYPYLISSNGGSVPVSGRLVILK